MDETTAWSFWNCLLYLFGSCGYTALDILGYLVVVDQWTSFVLYILLAAIFVLAAILFTIDWFQHVCFEQQSQKEKYQYKLKCCASIFDNVGSIAYMLGAIFGNNTPQDQQNLLRTPQLFVFSIVGMGAFLVEAIFTLLAWLFRPSSNRRCHCQHGVALWAHALSVIGGLVYLAASILPPILTLLYPTQLTQQTIYQSYVRPVQIAGDGVYLIDAVLYLVLWNKERKEMKSEEPVGSNGRHLMFAR